MADMLLRRHLSLVWVHEQHCPPLSHGPDHVVNLTALPQALAHHHPPAPHPTTHGAHILNQHQQGPLFLQCPRAHVHKTLSMGKKGLLQLQVVLKDVVHICGDEATKTCLLLLGTLDVMAVEVENVRFTCASVAQKAIISEAIRETRQILFVMVKTRCKFHSSN